MFYHLLAPWRWAPYMRWKFHWKILKCKVLTNKLQQKQWYAVLKSAANIYPSSTYEYFQVILLLTNHETLFNINIVLSIHQPFEPISALFTITGLWPNDYLGILQVSPKRVSEGDIRELRNQRGDSSWDLNGKALKLKKQLSAPAGQEVHRKNGYPTVSEYILSSLQVINFEFILKLKIKRNDLLLAHTSPQAANHCALF